MSKGVSQLAEAIAPKHVLEGHRLLGTGIGSLLESRIYVVDVQEDTRGTAIQGLRSPRLAPVRFVGEHDVRIANSDLSMHDLSIRRRHSEKLLCSKGFLIKINGGGCASDCEVRCGSVITIRNGFDFVAHRYLLINVLH